MSGDISNSAHQLLWNGTIRTVGETIDLQSTGLWIGAADSDDWTFTGDFTIEMFGMEFSSLAVNRPLITQDDTNSGGRGWIFQWHTSNGLEFIRTTDGSTLTRVSGAWSPLVDTPYDVCAERSGSTVRLYQGGTVLGSGTLSGANANVTTGLNIGRLAGGALEGLIKFKAVRITKGVARYEGAYSVPTLPLPTS